MCQGRGDLASEYSVLQGGDLELRPLPQSGCEVTTLNCTDLSKTSQLLLFAASCAGS